MDNFSSFLNNSFEFLLKEKLIISSNNKFSFKLNKKIKFSDLKFQSRITLDKLQYSNEIFKRFFPEYKKNIKFENNIITIDYNNKDYQINGNSNVNINGDVDNFKYSIKKLKKKFFMILILN